MKNLSTLVNFKFLDAKKNLIKDFNNEACFAGITLHQIDNKVKYIVVYSFKNRTAYNEEDCAKWIELIASFGFDVTYEGFGTGLYDTGENAHVILIPVRRNNKYRVYMNTILMFVRLLTESGISGLPKKYWELEEKFKVKSLNDKFELLQFVHQYNADNSNHKIRNHAPQKCLSLKEFKNKAKEAKEFTLSEFSYSKRLVLSDFWKGKYIMNAKNFESAKSNGSDQMNVYVVGGETHHANWLPCEINLVDNLEDAGLVIFTGGEDVSPQEMYNEPCNPNNYCNLKRDLYEKKIYNKAKKLKIPMLGICRGNQFLTVMNGGRLVQHQENKYANHKINTSKYGEITISSTHHQASYPFNLKPWQYRLIGWSENLSKYHLDGNGNEMYPQREVEIIYFPETKCLGIQGHPEFSSYQRNYPEDLKIVQQIFLDFMGDNL